MSHPSTLQGLSDTRSNRLRSAYTVTAFASRLFVSEGRRLCGLQVSRSVSLTACHRHYSGSPIAACSHCFTIGTGLRPKRRGSASSLPWQVYPILPDSPSNSCQGKLCRSCNVRVMLRPAVSAGATDWVQPQVISTDSIPAAVRGYRVGAVPPPCYHSDAPSAYSAKWETAEPNSFHSGRNKL